ncbi:hypothetical protein ACOMHN_011422 [Nucella lapillus]
MAILKTSPRRSFSFSVLLLFHHLLFLSTTTSKVVAQRNDIFSQLSTEACDCCDVSVTSPCCLNCLRSVVGRGTAAETEDDNESSPLSRFSRGDDEGRGYMSDGGEANANAVVVGSEEDSDLEESPLSACQCCSQSFAPATAYPRLHMLALTCCSLCHNLAPNTTPPPPPRRLPSLRRHHQHDVSRAMMSPVKRMTSMDCMCCMNSGISDCCSKCRIF